MSNVRGRFRDLEGRVLISSDLSQCRADASIAAASVDTGTPMRDDDLRSSNFLDAARFPSIAVIGIPTMDTAGSLSLAGDLTIRDLTHRVVIDVDFLGFDESGLLGEPRIGLSGCTTLRRSDFVVGTAPIAGNKLVVGDEVTIDLDIQAVLEQAS